MTHADIEDGRIPDMARGMLGFVAGRIAYRAVRNRGTIGGSIAHADPAADWVSVFPLLRAEIIGLGSEGSYVRVDIGSGGATCFWAPTAAVAQIERAFDASNETNRGHAAESHHQT